MTPDALGEVIATREFSFPDENGRATSVSIFIGKPLPSQTLQTTSANS